VVAELGVRRVIDVHDNKVTMVFAAVSRDSGWTAPRASLAMRVHTALKLVGNAALIGISNDVPATAHIPTALREAGSALAMATVNQRVVQFSGIPLRHLLLHFGAPELGRVLPAWTARFHDADDKSAGALAASLRAYARFDMNILKAADELGVHPNTLYARFERIHELSGLQPRSFDSLQDLLIVCDCGRGGGGRAR
jgi:sugar diacid utilization regulator